MMAYTLKGYYWTEKNKKLTDNLVDLKIMRIFAPSYYKTPLIQEDMETTIKRTREEVRTAFREVMRKKRERVQKSRENLEVMYQQGLFNY